MNPSRIEQAIDEIYNYVEECKPSKLYPSKVVVDREQLYDLLRRTSSVCTGRNQTLSENHYKPRWHFK